MLGWRIDTEAGTVSLPEQKHPELLQLLAIPATQRRMERKEQECLVEKIRSMHLAVPGAVLHLYHIQSALAQVRKDRSWLLADFHQEISD